MKSEDRFNAQAGTSYYIATSQLKHKTQEGNFALVVHQIFFFSLPHIQTFHFIQNLQL